ncbi:MAG: LapA family protein [Rhodospirillaceae bacterium]|nr:LapA family protein [Rhodospirillaceae bacterium]
MSVLKTLLAIVAGMIVMLFAVSNRASITLEFWPLPYRIDAGLYAVVLVALLLGFLAGAFATWLSGAERRRELRAANKRMREMEHSLARLKEDAAAARAKAEMPERPRAA